MNIIGHYKLKWKYALVVEVPYKQAAVYSLSQWTSISDDMTDKSLEKISIIKST